jgi:hypothetical protein
MQNLNINMNNRSWPAIIEEAEDGSGDGILTFPPELIEITGWVEGTKLNLEVKDGCLYITEI